VTSKERVLLTVCHERTDRFAADYHAGAASVNKRVAAALGVDSDDYADLLRRLGSDVFDIRGSIDPEWIAGFPQKWKLPNGDWRNWLGFTTREVMTEYGPMEEHARAALCDATTLAQVEAFRYPRADWFSFKGFGARLRPYRDLAIMASGPSYFQHPSFVRGLENLLCDFIDAADIATFIIGKYADFYHEYIGRLLEAAGGQIDLVRIADDMGTQIAPLMSLDMARTFLFPHIRRMCALAHGFGAKVMLHSCGSIASFIEEIIGLGVDVLDPLQPAARGMEFAGIYDRFAGRICLHGSIDTQHTLPGGTPEAVREEVFARLDVASSGKGGFIVAPAHVVQPDVPTENILALYGAVADYGRGM